MHLRRVPPPDVADHVASLTPYHPGKPIAEVKRELGIEDVVKLASNENALGPSQKAIAAVERAVWDSHLYPEGSCHDLRHALAEHLGADPDRLAFGNGSDEIIHLLGLAYLSPGDELLQADPTFTRYEAAATLNRATCVKVPLRDWSYDVEAMVHSLSAKTRLIFVANPNNPTGAYLDARDTERLMSSVPDRCVVCFDEAYFEFADAPNYPDTVSLVRANMNVVVLRTFSKVYGLAGLRIGYAVARPEIIAALEQVREPFNVNSLAQAAALAALQDTDHVRKSREMVVRGKRRLEEDLGSLGLGVYPSQGNFLWVDARRESRELFAQLLRRGVIVRTGDIFGAPTCLRITVGLPEQNARLIEALREVLST